MRKICGIVLIIILVLCFGIIKSEGKMKKIKRIKNTFDELYTPDLKKKNKDINSLLTIERHINEVLTGKEITLTIEVGEVSGYYVKETECYHVIFRMIETQRLLTGVMKSKEKTDVIAGDVIECTGKLTYNIEKEGILFKIDSFKKLYKGKKYQKYCNTKEILEKEGLFETKHKKLLPTSIHKIALVTNESGAGRNDFAAVLKSSIEMLNSFGLKTRPYEILHCWSPMSGLNCPSGVKAAIDEAERSGADIIVVTRGGGSYMSLWSFNSEEISRAVFECKTPIISAVGHEHDTTLIDSVSDVRASTPSHSAVLVAKLLVISL